MLTGKTISVVVACYRDAGNVREMYRRLTEVLAQVTPRYEIIYVNDNSPDNAEELLADLAAQDERLTVISHSRNFGSQMAFTSGMQRSVGDAVILMDGDLQDPPEVIPALVREWLAGYDVVYGVRERRREGRLMQAARKTFYRIYRQLSYLEMPLDAGDFSLMSRRVVEALMSMPERDRFLRGLRAWVGFRQTGVPYTRAERFAGQSTNSLLDNFRWAKRGIFSFSYQPLEMISLLSFLTTLATVAALYFTSCFTSHPERAARIHDAAGGDPVPGKPPTVLPEYSGGVHGTHLRGGQAAPGLHRPQCLDDHRKASQTAAANGLPAGVNQGGTQLPG